MKNWYFTIFKTLRSQYLCFDQVTDLFSVETENMLPLFKAKDKKDLHCKS